MPPRQSTDSVQPISKFHWLFYRNRKKSLKFMWKHKRPEQPKYSRAKGWEHHTTEF